MKITALFLALVALLLLGAQHKAKALDSPNPLRLKSLQGGKVEDMELNLRSGEYGAFVLRFEGPWESLADRLEKELKNPRVHKMKRARDLSVRVNDVLYGFVVGAGNLGAETVHDIQAGESRDVTKVLVTITPLK